MLRVLFSIVSISRKRQSVKDGEVLFTYLGIPFAEAPIQNLR
jgi:hypothetical protein